MQKIYLKKGLSKAKVSRHQKRLAIDLLIWDSVYGDKYISDEEWIEVGKYWESLNTKNRWGGNFGVRKKDRWKKIGWDRCHFERLG